MNKKGKQTRFEPVTKHYYHSALKAWKLKKKDKQLKAGGFGESSTKECDGMGMMSKADDDSSRLRSHFRGA